MIQVGRSALTRVIPANDLPLNVATINERVTVTPLGIRGCLIGIDAVRLWRSCPEHTPGTLAFRSDRTPMPSLVDIGAVDRVGPSWVLLYGRRAFHRYVKRRCSQRTAAGPASFVRTFAISPVCLHAAPLCLYRCPLCSDARTARGAPRGSCDTATQLGLRTHTGGI